MKKAMPMPKKDTPAEEKKEMARKGPPSKAFKREEAAEGEPMPRFQGRGRYK